jgi:hypothetical protein
LHFYKIILDLLVYIIDLLLDFYFGENLIEDTIKKIIGFINLYSGEEDRHKKRMSSIFGLPHPHAHARAQPPPPMQPSPMGPSPKIY